MADIIKQPIIMAIIFGSAVYVAMNYYNPAIKYSDKKKQKKTKKTYSSEFNIIVSAFSSLIIWYYLHTRSIDATNPIDISQINGSLTSSDAQKSYNLLGKGLQLPNGQQLPDIFHKLA